ncbi:DUF4395-like protein [Pontimonas salivibrio]|uniref:DUF4395-like protein n=1 Tax=Pontimonas salivibrio TaxID=1159327 RepID=A0A2L2BRP4_9MICO|nr:DUF4395 domain-containing protein [Pontimonas salivibrio]AVG24343.1 DUF4395-like protein [Pontimonas salivibrio]
MNTSSNRPGQIDPRGPRFGAAITSVLLLVVLALVLPVADTPAFDGAWWLFVVITALFAWGTLLGPGKHPYGALFKALIRPRLAPPSYLEDQAPPRFAQLVGLIVSAVGITLHVLAVPYGLVIAAAVAFLAAFLNAVFGLCLGCELYNVLLRLRRGRAPAGPSTP